MNPSEMLISIIKTLHLPTVYIFIPFLIFYAFGAIIKWLFPNESNWTTPLELRKRNNRKELEELINSESNSELKELLDNQREMLVFERISGIKEENKTARESLIRLKNDCPYNLKWSYIRSAYPELIFNNDGYLIKGIKATSYANLLLRKVFLIAFIGFGVYIGMIYNFPKTEDIRLQLNFTLIQMSLEAIFMLIGLLIIIPSIPAMQALQLRKYIT